MFGDIFKGDVLSGLGGSIVDVAGNYLLAQDAYNKNVEMWDKTNAYNSPKSQMARFAEAGLNPNLIYGQMGSTTASPVEYKRAEFGSVLGNAIKSQQVKNMDMQNKNLAVQNALLAQQINESKERERGFALDNELKGHENSTIIGTGVSKTDPWYLRFGGRFGRYLFGNNEYNLDKKPDWKPSKDDVKKSLKIKTKVKNGVMYEDSDFPDLTGFELHSDGIY